MIEAAEQLLDDEPNRMRVRRSTVGHPFGTLKAWMGYNRFLTRTLPRVSTEMSLRVLANNLKRLLAIKGAKPLIAAMQAKVALGANYIRALWAFLVAVGCSRKISYKSFMLSGR